MHMFKIYYSRIRMTRAGRQANRASAFLPASPQAISGARRANSNPYQVPPPNLCLYFQDWREIFWDPLAPDRERI